MTAQVVRLDIVKPEANVTDMLVAVASEAPRMAVVLYRDGETGQPMLATSTTDDAQTLMLIQHGLQALMEQAR